MPTLFARDIDVETEFYKNVAAELSACGYTGSYIAPYDETKDESKTAEAKLRISQIFRMGSRPNNPPKLLCEDNGDVSCIVICSTKFLTKKWEAEVLIDLCTDSAYRAPWLLERTHPSIAGNAMIRFDRSYPAEDVPKLLGFDHSGISDEDEDIEIDMENPLSLDFPEVRD